MFKKKKQEAAVAEHQISDIDDSQLCKCKITMSVEANENIVINFKQCT